MVPVYNFPNDDLEQDRLDLNHHVCLMLLNNALHFAPLADDKSLRILDIGTGTGIWAMDMGDKYPNAEVVSSNSDRAPMRQDADFTHRLATT
jgi:ubiquinone/menaquinone biosynthesis C-methylase UbiE